MIAARTLGLAIALFVLAACGLASFTADQSGTQDVPTTGPVVLDLTTFNGSIQVDGGPAATIHVTWTKRGSGETQKEADADLANVEVKVTEEPGKVRVVAKRTDTRMAWSSGASFVVTVPPKTPVVLRTSNGAVRVLGAGAGADLATSNGNVEVLGGAGKIDAKSSNGSMVIAATGASVRATSSNGNVRFSGSLADGENTLSSSNGSIDVALPADARFRLSAHTSNGSVRSDFPLDAGSKVDKRDVDGSVGANPAASLALRTSNGSIELSRAK